MARLKKADLFKKLEKAGIDYDEEATNEELAELLEGVDTDDSDDEEEEDEDDSDDEDDSEGDDDSDDSDDEDEEDDEEEEDDDDEEDEEEEESSKVSGFDIIRNGIYIRTLPKKEAHAFLEKDAAKEKAKSKLAGRKSYIKCEMVLASKNKKFVVRHRVYDEDAQDWKEKTDVFTDREKALNFAHQIPNTPVTLV